MKAEMIKKNYESKKELSTKVKKKGIQKNGLAHPIILKRLIWSSLKKTVCRSSSKKN